MSDDEFLKKIDIKKKGKKKCGQEEQIDLENMTKRQRMAYLSKQHVSEGPVQSKTPQTTILLNNRKIGATGAKTVMFGADEHTFYELSNAKTNPNKKGKSSGGINASGDYDSDLDEEDYAARRGKNAAN